MSYDMRVYCIILIAIHPQLKDLTNRNFLFMFNSCGKKEYVNPIECWHCIVKCSSRSYCAMLLFKYLLHTIVVHLLTTVAFCVSTFLWNH